MKKKVHPKDQTDELNRAKFEFLKRNVPEWEKLKILYDRDEKKRDEITTALASIGGNFDPEQKKRFDFFYKHSEVPFDEELAEYIKKIEVPKAVNSVWRWIDYNMEIRYQKMVSPEPMKPVMTDNLLYEDLKTEVFDMYCRDARGIFMELTNGRPGVHLLLGIDLTRSKEVIIEEVKKLVAEYQRKLGVHEVPEKRFRLSLTDELLQVWDLYEKSGKRPAKYSFKDIAREVKRPLSTVKDQWRTAYMLIKGVPYAPQLKYATEEKKVTATELCAKCSYDAICYKNLKPGDDWIGCATYQKIVGTEKKRTTIEFTDKIDYLAGKKNERKKTSDDQFL